MAEMVMVSFFLLAFFFIGFRSSFKNRQKIDLTQSESATCVVTVTTLTYRYTGSHHMSIYENLKSNPDGYTRHFVYMHMHISIYVCMHTYKYVEAYRCTYDLKEKPSVAYDM
jgi:hypothetical protein